MNYLLDTHTLIWAHTASHKLSANVQRILQDTNNQIVVSTLSFWEISLKRSLRKLALDGFTPEDFVDASIDAEFQILPLSTDLCSSFYKLTASHHKDPFDRMLIWQALHQECSLITIDKNIRKYTSEGLRVVW
ncbi:PIN domain nuclease, a component of toxin-antitoxin system (PIN domain) [Dyadobacter soli]|uniref:PIN domain nuclease, a component of toxin-antitoxin system (PIN domain) n=1 Tax=Dyadobacter soli TaxID=659014 RepID=A0A1G7UNS3_9BACT|nr:type II toxin-antitoxin system VapC family toxin [Dyadobacter soli]SDG49212.1 PIN domain nuclease, a component of toxin-antitoxin system (PIN domain) [Dyadobacter soli]